MGKLNRHSNDNKEDRIVAGTPIEILTEALRTNAEAMDNLIKAMEIQASAINQHAEIIEDHEYRIHNLEALLGE